MTGMIEKYSLSPMSFNTIYNTLSKVYKKLDNTSIKAIIAIIAVLHLILLHTLGVAWFGSTVIFYYLMYKVLKKIIFSLIAKNDTRIILLRNIQVMLLILLSIEFYLLFVADLLNNHMEKEYYVYFSDFKRKEQIQFLNHIGFEDIRNAWIEGYQPNTERSHRVKEFTYRYKTNKIGLRGILPAIRKDSNELRIAVLGDSFAEGFGTPDDSTIPLLLQQKINAECKNEKTKVNVINGGVCGSNPYYNMQLYANVLAKYKPDIVMMLVNKGDIEDFRITLHQGSMPVTEYLSALSHLFRVAEYEFIFKKRKSEEEGYSGILTDSLCKYNDYFTDREVDFICIYIPLLDNGDRINPRDALADNISKTRIHFFNLTDNICTVPDYSKLYWKEDGHFRPAGYNLIASNIMKYLCEKRQKKDIK